MGKVAWCVPPILGLVAFAAVRALASAVPLKSEVPGPAGGALLRATPSEVAGAAERAKAGQQEATVSGSESFPKDGEALKAEFLKLKQRLKNLEEAKNWPAHSAAMERYHQLGLELGRQLGIEAMDWIREVDPGVSDWVMEGWAETDSSEAFDAVTRANHPRPCDDDLLLKLIAAQKDGKGMKAAVLEVPWHLFPGIVYHGSLDDSSTGFEARLPKGANPSDWIDSGAAEAMAEKGVQIRMLFYQWAQENPEQALARWETWPDERPQIAKARLFEILQAASERDNLVARVRAAWTGMSAEEQGRVSEVFDTYQKGLPQEWQDPNDKLLQAFQFLVPSSVSPALPAK